MDTNMEYGYRKRLDIPFEEAESRTREELANQGFGIITEIDVRKTFKNKLDKEFDNYVILGACHPNSAYKILSADKELGLFLPCNVIVYQDGGSVFVSAIMPKSLIKMSDNENLSYVAEDIEMKLKAMVDVL
ncbi:MAG: protein of unknown function DUF302 [uncultured bacterium]|nr:MAG: protein of unknown function DUF302 [uncultured bacterium]